MTKTPKRLPDARGWDVTRYWRLVSVDGGPVTGTFWVTRPDEKRRGKIHVHAVDVTLWDEDRNFGRCFTTKDQSCAGWSVQCESPGPGRSQVRWADLTEDDAEHLKAAVLAAVAAVEWPTDTEAGES